MNIETGRLIEFGTPTGSFKTFEHWVTLSVLNYDFDVPVCFAAAESFSRNVWGRIGFLNQVLARLHPIYCS
ncbi:MAG: hypothetical protein H7Z37_02845 [Pyrinomonadaceae bacterium]|nr:hypothetical protein [Pyrinomonadaceae bacterium]